MLSAFISTSLVSSRGHFFLIYILRSRLHHKYSDHYCVFVDISIVALFFDHGERLHGIVLWSNYKRFYTSVRVRHDNEASQKCGDTSQNRRCTSRFVPPLILGRVVDANLACKCRRELTHHFIAEAIGWVHEVLRLQVLLVALVQWVPVAVQSLHRDSGRDYIRELDPSEMALTASPRSGRTNPWPSIRKLPFR